MTNSKNSNNENKYDLEERTAKFGEDVINLCRNMPKNELTRRIIDQLVGCSTSVGANYCEADNAESRKDFKHKIGICKKEARESMHFLRMASIAIPAIADNGRILWKEAKELNLIFNKIFRSSQ
ncbi:MAG: four helix bundle protein [Patescibacteria group bacterium]